MLFTCWPLQLGINLGHTNGRYLSTRCPESTHCNSIWAEQCVWWLCLLVCRSFLCATSAWLISWGTNVERVISRSAFGRLSQWGTDLNQEHFRYTWMDAPAPYQAKVFIGLAAFYISSIRILALRPTDFRFILDSGQILELNRNWIWTVAKLCRLQVVNISLLFILWQLVIMPEVLLPLCQFILCQLFSVSFQESPCMMTISNRRRTLRQDAVTSVINLT
jgi:hypothetical protein